MTSATTPLPGPTLARRASARLLRALKTTPCAGTSTTWAVLAACVAVAVGTLATTHAVSQTPDQRKLRMQSLAVSDNLYLLSGGGTNALVMTADSGVVLVDAQPAGWGRAIVNAYSPITDQQLTTVIVTHAHADHAGALPELPVAAHIVAHERTKARLAQLEGFRDAGAKSLPNEMVTDAWSALDGQDRVEAFYAGAAHTDGDLVVVFPGKRTALLGDLFPEKAAPHIDAMAGGSALAFPETLSRAIAKLSGVTRVVPGHVAAPPGSPVGRWMTMADLQEYADFNRAFVDAVKAAHAAGKSEAEAASTLTLPERFQAYGMTNAKANVSLLYRELARP